MKKLLCLIITGTLLVACKKQSLLTDHQNDAQTGKLVTNTAVAVTVNTPTTILDDGFGYNTRFPDTHEPWESAVHSGTTTTWGQALDASFANCTKYPGGTVANFWNANTNELFSKKTTADPSGWIDIANTGWPDINSVVSAGNQQINSLADLKSAIDLAGITPIFVLNIVTPGKDFYQSAQGWNRTVNDHPGTTDTSDDWYKMLDARYDKTKQTLIKAHNNGITPKYIEMGNECYIASSPYYVEAFPNGQSYAAAANYIANKLRTDPDLSFLPAGLKISVPGAVENTGLTSARILAWNGQMMPNLNQSLINAVSLHSYQVADNSTTTFNNTNITQDISDWMGEMETSMGTGSIGKKTNSLIVNAGWATWWTELSFEHTTGAVHNKWGAVLQQIYAGMWCMEKNGQVFMNPNFDANSVVDNTTGELNAKGWGFTPLMRASNGNTDSRKLNFPGVTTFETGRTVLQGYLFTNAGNNRKICIINLSNTQYTVNLNAAFPVANQLTISGQQNTDLNSTDDPTHIGDHTDPTNTVVIVPYSVNFIRP